ncbi:MAG: hypothetical protein JGK17_16220 [Microcoleus sp. PH2017_10_PVI_O_A]|uniref:hypothetical protein n=1 Tax=unclassified Microcoleus TaxID=2642155 RepID=UPI001E181141|nr:MULTISPECIES: hypothetical protein [unclassified Microcoleus]MCC3407106.1 hypothetical protein [Microcoleus sp. PH2017_10_PVI_O_A]MCC3461116.1 hypothetical protein [Microcoleus sp. PH2017_11_PCY_U_A]MCC3560478.1 hypothetical protein [Microcoleus sp. PH2017_27_LUM_O_A]
MNIDDKRSLGHQPLGRYNLANCKKVGFTASQGSDRNISSVKNCSNSPSNKSPQGPKQISRQLFHSVLKPI